MAKNDIEFFRPPPGRNPGTVAYGMTAAETFEGGEVVVVAAAGGITECADDPATVTGISLGSTQGKTAAGINGAIPTGKPIQVYTVVPGQLFITENWQTDGAGTKATPTLANVGDTAGFTLGTFDSIANSWSVDTNATNAHVEVVDVLDASKHSVGDTLGRDTGTAVFVVFGFV